jgi:AcrR family transcriptional regulator
MSEDRRVIRTKQLLHEALMELVLEQDYDSIRVQDITDRAGVGRATLYLHYHDKEDLLLSSVKRIVNELIELSNQQPVTEAGRREPRFVVVLKHAAENPDLYQVLLSGQGGARVRRELRRYIARTMLDGAAARGYPGRSDFPLEVAVAHIVGGMIYLLEWWLDHDMPYTPEEMGRMFREINEQGIQGVLTVGDG